MDGYTPLEIMIEDVLLVGARPRTPDRLFHFSFPFINTTRPPEGAQVKNRVTDSYCVDELFIPKTIARIIP
jgi:hypothetical protein